MSIFSNTVGKKLLMALSGLAMLGFVIMHLLGNASIFGGPEALNTYAEKLHSLGPLVWVFRLVMITALGVHVIFAINLTLENWAANPGKYSVNRHLKANVSSKTMIWTGALLFLFILYHLAQFTLRITPDIAPEIAAEVPGDVFGMVTGSFSVAPIVGVYVVGMIVLFLHLKHGIQSFLQTLGLSNDRVQPKYVVMANLLSLVLFAGFGAIPVAVIIGVVAN